MVSEPGALLQLCNETQQNLDVLYIVTPSYVFETGADGQVIYDDSILIAQDWDALDGLDA